MEKRAYGWDEKNIWFGMPPVNWDSDIDLFVRVADLGSFAAVAEETGLSPPGVSKAVTRLEDRLGVALLRRSTRILLLTQEGEVFLRHARGILDAVSAARAAVAPPEGGPNGLLRVNSGSAFAKHRLAPWLPEFRRRYPGIELDISVTDRRVDLLEERADVAIRVGPLADSRLIGLKIGEVRRVIAASPDYLSRHGTPAAPEDLARHDCLVLSGFRHLSAWPFTVKGKTVRIPVEGTCSSDSADLLLDMAIQGLGIIRFGDFLGEEAVASGRLVPLFEDTHDPEPRPITALTSPELRRADRVRVFLDFLKEKSAAAA